MEYPCHQMDCTQQLSKHVVNKMTELVSCDLPNLSVTKVIFFFDPTREVAEAYVCVGPIDGGISS